MKKLQAKLKERELAGNLRKLTTNEGLEDFFSNDYLGLAKSEKLFKAAEKELNRHFLASNRNGSTGSRLLSGNSAYVIALENYLASFFHAENTLLFNSGYNANLSILSSVPQKDDTILYDELIHASLKEGARLSFAKRFSFKHNNLADLEKKLQKATGEVYLVVESVYSMDGDFCPLEELVTLAEGYKAHVILDEAHSTGLWGVQGNGLACDKKLEDKIFARIYTFGKAMGIHGACIAGSEFLINYLINFARPFIYTTSLPPHSLASVKAAFELVKDSGELRTTIFRKINLFKEEFNKQLGAANCLLIESGSPIQALKIAGNSKAKAVAEKLSAKGFDVRAILSPTVKEGEERLRLCLHVYNEDEQLVTLVKALKEAL